MYIYIYIYISQIYISQIYISHTHTHTHTHLLYIQLSEQILGAKESKFVPQAQIMNKSHQIFREGS